MDEDAGVVSLNVTVLEGILGTDIQLNLTTQDGDAVCKLVEWWGCHSTHNFPLLLIASGDNPDYVPVNDQLTLSPSETSVIFVVQINDDNISETNEKFNASLSLVMANDRVTVLPKVAEVTIIDNEGENKTGKQYSQ